MSDHLTALIFLVNTELTEAQLQQLNQYLEGRNIHMRNYTLSNVQEAYKTLFASVRTGIGNPMVRPRASRTRGTKRSFYLFEAGEYEGEEGYWAKDEETNEEAFLSTENETFWTLDEAKDEWHEANVAGRRIKKRGKGSTKSKRKFNSKRRGKFRPHKSGRAHVVNDDQPWQSGQWDEYSLEAYNDTLFGKGKGYGWKSGSEERKARKKMKKEMPSKDGPREISKENLRKARVSRTLPNQVMEMATTPTSQPKERCQMKLSLILQENGMTRLRNCVVRIEWWRIRRSAMG